MADEYKDSQGNELDVGNFVYSNEFGERAEIYDLLESDVDEDQWGRPVGVPPRIVLLFTNGDQETITPKPPRFMYDDEPLFDVQLSPDQGPTS